MYCLPCSDGNSLIPANPKLAGQHAAYITKQLLNFKSGVRDNIVMAGMVANLTEQDMRNLGLFYETQPLALAEAKKNGVGSLGEKIFRSGLDVRESQLVQAAMDLPDMVFLIHIQDLMRSTLSTLCHN